MTTHLKNMSASLYSMTLPQQKSTIVELLELHENNEQLSQILAFKLNDDDLSDIVDEAEYPLGEKTLIEEFIQIRMNADQMFALMHDALIIMSLKDDRNLTIGDCIAMATLQFERTHGLLS